MLNDCDISGGLRRWASTQMVEENFPLNINFKIHYLDSCSAVQSMQLTHWKYTNRIKAEFSEALYTTDTHKFNQQKHAHMHTHNLLEESMTKSL
jgi:hypothetical protein